METWPKMLMNGGKSAVAQTTQATENIHANSTILQGCPMFMSHAQPAWGIFLQTPVEQGYTKYPKCSVLGFVTLVLDALLHPVLHAPKQVLEMLLAEVGEYLLDLCTKGGEISAPSLVYLSLNKSPDVFYWV